MRTLKLQMNISLDNKWDDGMTKFSIDNLKNVDNILLGRNTAEGFIPYWDGVAKDRKDSLYKLGRPLADIPKVVFSEKLDASKWDNATLLKGDIAKEIKALKRKKGKDIIVYGGDSFVASLLQHNLIDEFYLLVNPGAIGNEQPTFNPLKNNSKLKLVKSKPFDCGAVLLCYAK